MNAAETIQPDHLLMLSVNNGTLVRGAIIAAAFTALNLWGKWKADKAHSQRLTAVLAKNEKMHSESRAYTEQAIEAQRRQKEALAMDEQAVVNRALRDGRLEGLIQNAVNTQLLGRRTQEDDRR